MLPLAFQKRYSFTKTIPTTIRLSSIMSLKWHLRSMSLNSMQSKAVQHGADGSVVHVTVTESVCFHRFFWYTTQDSAKTLQKMSTTYSPPEEVHPCSCGPRDQRPHWMPSPMPKESSFSVTVLLLTTAPPCPQSDTWNACRWNSSWSMQSTHSMPGRSKL